MAKKPSQKNITKKPRKTVKKAIVAANTKIFNKKVKKAMGSLIETKRSGLRDTILPLMYVAPNLPAVTGNQVACDSINVIDCHNFQIPQGTGESNRVGNSINVVKQKMRYCISLLPQNVNGNSIPVVVRLIFFYDRADTNSLPTPYINNNFLDSGNSSMGFTGAVEDLFYRYNDDRYRIMGVKTHKIGFANNGQFTNSATLANQLYTNNDSSMFVMDSVDMTDWVIKKQKFNDNFVLTYSRGLYCLVHTVYQTGNQPQTSMSMVRFTYEIEQQYNDL